MSTQNDALAAMLAQYENNNKPKYEKRSDKVYDLKNYFTTHLEVGVKSATKQIRILPTKDSSTPFVEFYGHKAQINGDWKTFACLKEEKGEACPFCEAREALLSTGKDTDKELAKNYAAKMMYIVKVIDRAAESEGVKFWRFNHDYRKEGIYDKIFGVLNAIKKDVTDAKTGRDLIITINRNQSGVPIISAVASLDPSVLSEDESLVSTWLADERTWEDVYSVKSYDYLAIIVKGGEPVWNKESKKFVDKASLKDGDAETNNLDTELTLGIENVKDSITMANTTKTTSVTEEETDDLPF